MKITRIDDFKNKGQIKGNGPVCSEGKEKPLKFPKPNRSGFTPNFEKTDEDDHIDLAWAEGLLSDGRPFRVECWAAWQCTCLTYFMSTLGLENATNEELKQLMEQEGIAVFYDEKYQSEGYDGCNVDGRKVMDDAGNEMWSITITVGDEDGTYATNGIPLVRYDTSD